MNEWLKLIFTFAAKAINVKNFAIAFMPAG